MRNKNIAVLATALDSPEQAEIINGITEYGKGHNCNIAVFLWFTGAFEKEKHNQGEDNTDDIDVHLSFSLSFFSAVKAR